jgi:hypothetical protein
MLHNSRLKRLNNAKRSNLLVQFASYEEKEVLWIRFQETKSKGLVNIK